MLNGAGRPGQISASSIVTCGILSAGDSLERKPYLRPPVKGWDNLFKFGQGHKFGQRNHHLPRVQSLIFATYWATLLQRSILDKLV